MSQALSRDDVVSQTSRLSNEERDIIMTSYKKMIARKPNYAHHIFVGLFSEFPEYKDIWPNFRAVPDSAIVSSNALINHAHVYTQGLKCIINAMDNSEAFCRACEGIARSHAKWNIRKYHIDNMVPELLDAICKSNDGITAEEANAWSKLFDIIGNLVEVQKKAKKA